MCLRHLKGLGLQYKKLKKTVRLTNSHKKLRVAIAKKCLKDRIDFSKVVMTDEKKFKLDGPDNWFTYQGGPTNRQQRAMRQQGGHGTVLPTGAIHLEYLEVKVDAIAYKITLKNKVIPCIRQHMGNDFVLQQDNAPVHTAGSIKSFLAEINVSALQWPSKSPDRNIVEHVWGWLVEEVDDVGHIENVRQLKDRENST